MEGKGREGKVEWRLSLDLDLDLMGEKEKKDSLSSKAINSCRISIPREFYSILHHQCCEIVIYILFL